MLISFLRIFNQKIINHLKNKKMKKLELKNLKVKAITKEEKATIKGGNAEEALLSIGRTCSLRNSCERVCGDPIVVG